MSFDDETTFLCLVWTDYKRVGKPCVCKHPHPHTHTHSGCTDHKGCPWEANVPELLGGTVARCLAMPACLVLVPVPHYKQHLSHHNTKLASSKIQHHLLLHLTGEHR